MPSLVRPLLRLAAASALTLAAAGCHRQQSDLLRAAVIGSDAVQLGDPLLPPTSRAQEEARLNLAQGLVRFDASGQVDPGLAERWNVSDDGLSYIFRLESGEWPDGRKIMARDVARILKRQMRSSPDNPTREALGAVEDIVPMTDRVIEIRLRAPRPNLLQLLAQPEFALIREGVGSGPFRVRDPKAGEVQPAGLVRLTRRLPGVDGDPGEREQASLEPMAAAAAIAAFRAGSVDLVLGGTVADLPLATSAKLDRGALHFDPANGLFGLIPTNATGPLAEPDVRRLLNQAIDRAALVADLAVPGLSPRATLLQGGLEGIANPAQPEWLNQPLADRRAALEQEAQRLFGAEQRPRLTVALPDGPGGDLLFKRLFADWGAIGIGVDRVAPGKRADLKLIDAVAPSTSPAWFLRQFRCGVAPICVADADVLLQSARDVSIALQRAALLNDAATKMDEATLFMPLAAPIRWSLVGDRATAFQDNRFARHPLAGLMRRGQSRGYSQ